MKDDVYLRYQSFADQQELEKEIIKRNPYKIDIGAVFSHKASFSSEHTCHCIFLVKDSLLSFKKLLKGLRITGIKQKRTPFFQPKDHKMIKPGAFQAEEKELVFDIDMTDYDEVRTCCK